MKKLLLLTISIGFISCQPSGDAIQAINTIPATDLASMPMKWPSSKLPLKVYQGDYITNNLDASQESAGLNLVEQMMNQWNEADPSRTFFDVSRIYSVTNKDYTNLDSFLDNEIGVYKSTNWFNNISSSVLAVTSYLASNRGSYLEMIHGDIVINYEDFSFSDNPSDSTSAYDLPSVLLHEFGHLIGQKHTTSFVLSSVMKPELGMHDVKRNVFSYDIQSIKNLYNNNQALTASSNPLAISAHDEDQPVYVRGYIELRSSGECHHYQNGKLVDSHQAFSP